MTIDETLKKITDKFDTKVLGVNRKSDKRAYVDMYPKDIVDFTKFMLGELGLRFNIASAVDDFDGIEILYHFSGDQDGFIITIRAILNDKQDPHIDTITGVTKSAWWIEREIHELFGVHFNGNDDLRPLLLPDDWPKGVYPLRKNFIAPKRDSRKNEP
jgi:NADH-quinone oxidoreductase subunit C